MTPILNGFRFAQLLTTPTAPATGTNTEPPSARVPLFAALTTTHAELVEAEDNSAFAVAWERRPGHSELRILVGGRPALPAITEDRSKAGQVMPVMYPPGSTGRLIDTKSVEAQWAQLPVWVRCAGRPDVLWAHTDGVSGAAPGRGCFDDYVAHLPGVFVWLVIAEPLPPDVIEVELSGLEVKLPRLRARENSEPDRVALLRAESRYRELARSLPAGMWAVHVLVGGQSLRSTRRAAGLLCSASDLDDLPYILTPHTASATWDHIWTTSAIGVQGFASPFTASSELLAALARPPHRELPGIRTVEPAAFDLTPEDDGDIDLGEILDDADQPATRFRARLSTLNRHTFVAGATGSGKSHTIRHLLTGLHTAAVPWLVIEPAKAEYAGMAGRIGAAITVIRPGDPDAVPVGLNPLEPEPGFPIQTHIDLIRALFLAAFDAAEPFPQVLAHALTRCYTELGWDPVIGAPQRDGLAPRFPVLSDLQATALKVVEGIGYGREITDNVRGFIGVRIGALRLGTPGRFFEGGYPLDLPDLLRRNVVLEIEDIGNDADKAFFIGAILIRIVEHLRIHRAAGTAELAHVLVVEEAHRLLRRADPGTPSAHAVELFAAMLAEIRAYGEGIIVAEQIPTKITPDVLKNTALKILHRLPAAEDRDTLGATMNLDPTQSRHAVSLPPGRAIVFADGMDRPIRIQIPLGNDRRNEPAAPATGPTGDRHRQPPLLLRDLHRAHRLADTPHMGLWIELTLLAHLVGRPSPRPHRNWMDNFLANQPPPILTEAIAAGIDAAINPRYAGLSAYFPPEDLAEHLRVTMTHALHDRYSCQPDEHIWQAGPFRWADVEQALRAHEVDHDRPHPQTTAWAQRGLKLEGNVPAQLDALRNHPDSWAELHIVTGSGTPSRLASLVTRLSKTPNLAVRLESATHHLILETQWPLALLDTAREQ